MAAKAMTKKKCKSKVASWKISKNVYKIYLKLNSTGEASKLNIHRVIYKQTLICKHMCISMCVFESQRWVWIYIYVYLAQVFVCFCVWRKEQKQTDDFSSFLRRYLKQALALLMNTHAQWRIYTSFIVVLAKS